MGFQLKCLILTVMLSIDSIAGQGYQPRCPSDQTFTSGCPLGWFSYLANCYQFNITQASYLDAKDACNRAGARLLRVNSKQDVDTMADLLNQNAVNRSIAWYTAGMIDPAFLGRFVWEGYPPALRQFNADLTSLFIEVPDLNNANRWISDRTRVVFTYYNMRWQFNITVATDRLYSICEASKAIISKAVTPTRGADFGQSDLTKVLRGPCITVQPVDTLYAPVITNSQSVTFMCGVYGNPMPTVKWFYTIDRATGPARIEIDPMQYRNGRVTQTGGLLTISEPDREFYNPIECQVSNDYGVVISKQVRIIVGNLEKYIKNARQEKVINDNTGFLLDCEAPKHEPADSISYTFYIRRLNDKGIEIDDVIQSQLRNNIFLSFNLGLIGFSIASSKDSGTYMCMLGFKGATGNSFKSPDIPLRVVASNTPYPVPAINDKFPNYKPSNPFLGDTVELECFGYGEILQNPLRYIWYWNGKQLPPKAKITDFERRVTITNVQFEDEGVYGCKIETHDGKVSDTKTVKLVINAKPTFITTPTNQYPDVGSTVILNCKAVGKPQVSIKWYRNEVPLSTWLVNNPEATRYNMTEGNISQGVLSIGTIKSADNAMIGCVITNMFGKDSAFIELKTMSLPPNFNKYPVLNSEAILGSNTIMQCQPEGSPTSTITWSINGNTVTAPQSFFNQATGNIDCGGHLCMLPNNNLFIKNVVVGDKGIYACTAKNLLGSSVSSAYLDVIGTLTVNNFPVGRRVQVDTNVYLPCQASGTPYLDIDYDWYFENVQIRFDRMDMDARRYDKSQFLRPYYRYFGTLSILNIQFYDEGNYTCRINTPFNTIEKSALIQVLGPPGVGGGITIAPVVGNISNIVEWTDGYDHGKPILWYKLEVAKEDGLQKWYVLVARINKTDVTVSNLRNVARNQYMFSGLPANTNFRLRIYAANMFGIGVPSSQSDVFKTAAIPPVKFPQNVTGGGGKVGTLVIRWEPLNVLEENGDNFIYEIHYKEAKELEWVFRSNMLNKSLEDDKYRQVTIDLPANKDFIPYQVQVRAANKEGPGPWSPISTITSASKLPSFAPQDVHAGSFNSTAIEVDWKPPAIGPGEGPIQGYHIVYWVRGSDCKSQAAYKDRTNSSQRLTIYGGEKRKGIIIGLMADRYYCIGVQMYNTAGDSLESSFVDQTTFKMPPQNFPTMMRLNSTNTPHQIRVTWNGVRVMPEEESVDGYRIRYWESGAPVRIAKDVDVGLKITGVINDLQYNVRYNMRVFAYSRGGNGKLSNPMDQFMLIPADRCQKNLIIEGPDVRYVFVCSGCHQSISLVLLVVAMVLARVAL